MNRIHGLIALVLLATSCVGCPPLDDDDSDGATTVPSMDASVADGAVVDGSSLADAGVHLDSGTAVDANAETDAATAADGSAARDATAARDASDPRDGGTLDAASIADGAVVVTDAGSGGDASIIPNSGHPRLWFRAQDVARLRTWAHSNNPTWVTLSAVAQEAVADMDQGRVPQQDPGAPGYSEYPTEAYAELFAFMSLMATNTAEKQQWADRARTLLMHVIQAATQGVGDAPFRYRAFSTSDRSRWHGEGFGLTVDWIYPFLTAQDKTAIRTVFLRWVDENRNAATTNNNHPVPVGVVNDPQLIADKTRVRWAGNNYFTAHMRNMALMSLALDAQDDPDGTLTGALAEVTGAWLYMVDHMMRTQTAGGLFAEGLEYSPQAMGYVIQTLLALKTSGQDDPTRWGRQVSLTDNPIWDAVLPALLHSVGPAGATSADPNYAWMGPLYPAAWYGSAQFQYAPDPIQNLGPLAMYDLVTGPSPRVDAIRWVQQHVPAGGPNALAERMEYHFRDAIFYFAIMDPGAGTPADPRPSLPLDLHVPGIHRVLSRTDWTPAASWFTYSLGWQAIDHQSADANNFELFRKGEWLTKRRTGYDVDYLASDNHNTLCVYNGAPQHTGDYRQMLAERGSQFMYVVDGDPTLVALSMTPDFVYALGDATHVYNSTYEGLTRVQHASRSLVWLKPDAVVTLDRARTTAADQFKRWWLQLPAPMTIQGTRGTMTSPGGQQLVVSSLLPQQATLSSQAAVYEPSGDPANLETMTHKLRIDAPSAAQVHFLTVVQAADSGITVESVELVNVTAGGFAGARVGTTALLFPLEVDSTPASIQYTVPATTTAQLITGLAVNAGYTVTQTLQSGGMAQIIVTAGGPDQSDAGGVIFKRF